MFAEWSGFQIAVTVTLTCLVFGFAFWIVQNYSGKTEGIPITRIRNTIPRWIDLKLRYLREKKMQDPLWTRTASGYVCEWGRECIKLTADNKHQKLIIIFSSFERLELFFAGGDLLSLRYGKSQELKLHAGVEAYAKSAWKLLQEVRKQAGLAPQQRGSEVEAFLNTDPRNMRRTDK